MEHPSGALRRLRVGHDILRRLQLARSIFRAVHVLRSRPTLGSAQWDGMERGDKKRKGDAEMNKKQIQKKLEERVKAELEPVDVEQIYRDMLDESGPEVNVSGLSFMPSRVVEELDPVAFRCGVCDYVDSLVGESLSDEIDGNHYNLEEVNEILEEILEEIESEDAEEVTK